MVLAEPRSCRFLGIDAVIGVEIAGRSEGDARAAGDADCRSNIVEGVRCDVGDEAVMSADAVPELSAGTHPVEGIEFEEAAGLAARAHRVEALQLVLAVAREEELAGEAGTYAAVVDQRQRDVVVARGEARLGTGLAERYDGLGAQHILLAAFEIRGDQAGGAERQVPVARNPASLARMGGGYGHQARGENQRNRPDNTHRHPIRETGRPELA